MAKAKKNASGFGFRVSPADAQSALDTLRAYVEERTEVIREKKIPDLRTAVQMMDAIYRFKENLSSLVKSPVEKAYDTLRFTVIPEFMDEEGTTSMTYEGIGRVNVIDDISLKTNDKEGLKEWLREVDLDDLIQETVNAQTLSAALRKRLKDNKSMPPSEVVTVTPIARAQITRSA